MSGKASTEKTHTAQAIEDCMEAYKQCIQAAAYCADQGGDLAAPQRLQVLHDCAEVNLLLVNFLSRASRFHRPLASLCMEVSEACADALSSKEHGDARLRVVYAACLRSAQACAELLGRAEVAVSDARDEAVWESFPASDPPPPPTEL